MTDDDSASAPAGPDTASTAAGGVDDRVVAIRRQRDVAMQTGDRETAQEFDALERELYDAGADGGSGFASPDAVEAASFTETDHAPLTADETEGVLAFLDEVDGEAAATLRAEWGSDAAANLGYAHLWFTTQYTQDERESMVVTPGLVRMAARMGRGLAADRRVTQTQLPSGRRDTAADGTASQSENVGELRRRKEEALRAGDHRLARHFDEEERALYARLHGDGPIVGHAGRTI